MMLGRLEDCFPLAKPVRGVKLPRRIHPIRLIEVFVFMRQGNTKDQCSQKKYDVTQQEEARRHGAAVNPKAFMENWYI